MQQGRDDLVRAIYPVWDLEVDLDLGLQAVGSGNPDILLVYWVLSHMFNCNNLNSLMKFSKPITTDIWDVHGFIIVKLPTRQGLVQPTPRPPISFEYEYKVCSM